MTILSSFTGRDKRLLNIEPTSITLALHTINRCYFVKDFLQNALIHPVYLEKTLFEQSLPCQNAIKQD